MLYCQRITQYLGPEGAILFEFLETVIIAQGQGFRERFPCYANDCVKIFLYEILVQFVYFNQVKKFYLFYELFSSKMPKFEKLTL